MNSLKKCIIGNSSLFRVFQERGAASSVRFLYSDQFLGIDRYVEARDRTISRLGSMRGNFFERMRNQVKGSSPSMVFTEDLKTIIHSCEDKPEDLELCIEMMKRFHKQNSELRFGTFVFGPVTMRLFHYFRKQDIVKNCFKDPELDGFFDQLKSYFLYMDLNFKCGMYEDIIKDFQELQEKHLVDNKYPRDPLVLTIGACYKVNTPESFKLATDLISSARQDAVHVLRRALVFAVALSLNQSKYDVALEILSSIDRFNNITGNNLKLQALAGLDRLQDAFDILRRVTDQDRPSQTRIRGEICQTTLDALQKSVDKVGDTETSHIFEQLCRSLKENNSITNQTIDDFVCSQIDPRPFREGNTFGDSSRFPDQPFRAREKEAFDRDYGYSPRRRRFAGISDDF